MTQYEEELTKAVEVMKDTVKALITELNYEKEKNRKLTDRNRELSKKLKCR